jgi:cytochrome c556
VIETSEALIVRLSKVARQKPPYDLEQRVKKQVKALFARARKQKRYKSEPAELDTQAEHGDSAP